MPLYTFYLRQANGDAWSFEAFDLEDDVAAYEAAVIMLDQHLSAADVAVWCGERKVCTVPRDGVRLSAAIGSVRRPGAA